MLPSPEDFYGWDNGERMIEVPIPGRTIQLNHLVLDLNGTVAMDGEPIPGVAELLSLIRRRGIQTHSITAGTHGGVEDIDRAYALTTVRMQPGQEDVQKAKLVIDLEAENVVAIGNGTNDALMLRAAAIGIAVMGPEGVSAAALQAADVVAGSPEIALGLLLHEKRLVGTLRNRVPNPS